MPRKCLLEKLRELAPFGPEGRDHQTGSPGQPFANKTRASIWLEFARNIVSLIASASGGGRGWLAGIEGRL
jgi:hypothetical protein